MFIRSGGASNFEIKSLLTEAVPLLKKFKTLSFASPSQYLQGGIHFRIGVESDFSFYSLITSSFTSIKFWNWIFALSLVWIYIIYDVPVIVLLLFNKQINSSPISSTSRLSTIFSFFRFFSLVTSNLWLVISIEACPSLRTIVSAFYTSFSIQLRSYNCLNWSQSILLLM